MRRANESNSKIIIVIRDIISTKINCIADDLKAKVIVDVSPADSADNLALKMKYMFKGKYVSRKMLQCNNFLKRNKMCEHSKEAVLSCEVPAMVMYTSGTTGNTKGVTLSNENVISSHKMISFGSSEVNENAAFLGVIPFFSAYGAITGMNNSLCCGWKIVLIPKFKPNQFGELLIKHKPASVLGVPRFWESVEETITNQDLSFLKNPICGGDKISLSSVEKINRYLVAHNANPLKIGYGASEFGGGIVITREDDPYKENCVGKILPGVIGLTIDPETGSELKCNEVGELCFHSPTMMIKYFENDYDTDLITIVKDNVKFYRTGDKGYIDENSNIYVIDRYKRVMMRPDGHTVHTTPIENTILKCPLIKDCAVVGLKMDKGSGVIPTAFIVLKKEKYYLIKDLHDLCIHNLPERDLPMAYVAVEQIPYTLMGKIDFKKLEEKRIDEVEPFIVDYTFIDKNGKAK